MGPSHYPVGSTAWSHATMSTDNSQNVLLHISYKFDPKTLGKTKQNTMDLGLELGIQVSCAGPIGPRLRGHIQASKCLPSYSPSPARGGVCVCPRACMRA